MEDLQKKWLETGIDNDFVFYYVMRNNPDLCLELLQLIFPELGITSIKPVETQKVLEEANDAHGVRLDAYTEDNAERSYDIEMQATNKGDLKKRSRYNQAMMDMYQLSRSMDYEKLKQSFVIFICNFDLFGQRKYVYKFENTCQDNYNLKLEDGVVKVFVNAKGKVGDVSEGLKNFLKMVATHEATDDFTRRLQKAVDFVHMDEETRIKYMTIGMKIIEERNDALRMGIEQGIEQGIEKGIKSLVVTVKKLNGTKKDAVEGVVDEYSKDKDEAIELVEKYW